MLKYVLTYICMVILSLLWLFVSSTISYFIKKRRRRCIAGSSFLGCITIISIGIEICISLLFIIFSPFVSNQEVFSNSETMAAVVKGYYMAVLMSPISTTAGTAFGLRAKRLPISMLCRH